MRLLVKYLAHCLAYVKCPVNGNYDSWVCYQLTSCSSGILMMLVCVVLFFLKKSKVLKEVFICEFYSNGFCKTWEKVHFNHTSSCAQITEYHQGFLISEYCCVE